MVSAFFLTWSIWFTVLFLLWTVSGVIRRLDAKVLDVFLGSVVFSFLASLPSFYGVFKLLEAL